MNNFSGFRVTVNYIGLPFGSTWSVQDNPADSGYDVTAELSSVSWVSSPCCTDGGAISGLQNSVWDIGIDLGFVTDISSWEFLSMDESGLVSSVAIAASDMGSEIRIVSSNTVPEPVILPLLAIGLLGMVGAARCRAKV